MSIPLDRLYYYIENLVQKIRGDRVIIYRFYPHGSKKVEDLTPLRYVNGYDIAISPIIYCNDQEPLNYEAYQHSCNFWPEFKKLLSEVSITIPSDLNFRKGAGNIYDQSLLLHSEKRSTNLDQYRSAKFIPVYYWSHAVIALDWFRYANFVNQKKQTKCQFLIYNRAWSGTREYRLGFTDRLISNNLVDNCFMRVSPVDSTIDKHYDLHQFERPEWRPVNVIENYFPLCEAESHYSADFNIDDYEFTDIEVVLETLFDDLRLHLTEKTLRPIAMGQPFILAGTYGSLKYLREYGFKTFADCWDESYDMMSDSSERMNKIIDVMKNITCMQSDKRDAMLARAREIAEYNKKHFFSAEFFNQVIFELQNNLTLGIEELENTNTSQQFFNWRKQVAQYSEIKQILLNDIRNGNRQEIAKVVSVARQYYIRTLKHNT